MGVLLLQCTAPQNTHATFSAGPILDHVSLHWVAWLVYAIGVLLLHTIMLHKHTRYLQCRTHSGPHVLTLSRRWRLLLLRSTVVIIPSCCTVDSSSKTCSGSASLVVDGAGALLTINKYMAAERAHVADPHSLGDAAGVELVLPRRARHDAHLPAVHEILDADAAPCDAAADSAGAKSLLL